MNQSLALLLRFSLAILNSLSTFRSLTLLPRSIVLPNHSYFHDHALKTTLNPKPKKDVSTYIYNAQEEVEMKFSCICPKPGKSWHGVSRNQGVVG